MDYEELLFYPNSTKMSQSHCLAPATSKLFKVSRATATSQYLPTSNDLNYSLYADNFDLSLLPQDCISHSENIPTTVYQFTNDTPTAAIITTKIEPITATTTTTTATTAANTTSISSTTTTPQIKIEQNWSYLATNAEDVKQEPTLPLPPPAYPHVYPSPQSSPAQSEYGGGGFTQTQYAGCYDTLNTAARAITLYSYPSSPCPSIEAANIKQELHILPPSPPESNCEAPSPHSTCADIKLEPIDADVESSLVDLNTLLKKQQQQYDEYLSTVQQQQQYQQTSATTPAQQDHQLLREYLEDNTFQKKHNLKPLALESFIGDLEEVRGDIEPVISLALEYAKREADETCAKLHISQDPSAWTPIQVHAWLRSTIAQFKLPQIDDLDLKFSEDGAALILLSEEEFTRRTPESGSFLHAQLEIWKLTFTDNYRNTNSTQQTEINTTEVYETVAQVQNGNWLRENGQQNASSMELGDDSDDEEDNILPSTSSAAAAAVIPTITTPTTATANAPKRAGATPGRSGGSHIHLWQFLKELLALPHLNGTAIRWIERSTGIFKIEDSVRVAKLWGKRKNRPAMNYDKLSRSIRQYYKKGIMKKTERSQRLVYQFCHPYHL